MTAWQREPPQEDGYYWFRHDPDSGAWVVKVWGNQVRIYGEWRPLADMRGEWCGPLVPPGESESP